MYQQSYQIDHRLNFDQCHSYIVRLIFQVELNSLNIQRLDLEFVIDDRFVD